MPIAIAKRISRNQGILSAILIEPPHQIPPIILEAPTAPNTQTQGCTLQDISCKEYPRRLKDLRQSGCGIARIAHLLAGNQGWIAPGIVASGHPTAQGAVTRLSAVTSARAVVVAVLLGVSPH